MHLLEAVGIGKSYGGVTALRDCHFRLAPATVHALLGENGAGKSTLVKVLTGAVRQDTGQILLDGKPVRFADAEDAARHGVAVVSQELNLFPDLDVLGNLFLGRAPLRWGFFSRREMIRRAAPVLDELGLTVPPGTAVGSLPLAQRQLLEIAKALLAGPRVLILDEPTSALEDEATARLLHVVRVLRERQVAVVFVSHILEEVMALSDVVTVLRDGEVAMAGERRDKLTIEAIVTAMLGATHVPAMPLDPTSLPGPDGPEGGSADLEVRGLAAGDELRELDFTARRGEIVGLTGVAGAGHRVVLEVIAGVRRPTAGSLLLRGGDVPRRPARTLRQAVRSGIAVVPGDRRRGLLFDRPIWVNIAQVRAVALGRDGIVLNRARLRGRAQARVRDLTVRASSVDQQTGLLSGGNQQKVVLAKCLEAEPSVLLLDDPTRGVAVGSKAEIHRLLRRSGASCVILLYSTDLDELVSLCDRVLVFRRGGAAAELSGPDLTRHRLLTEMNAGPDGG